MEKYFNLVEVLVEDVYDEIKEKLDICLCDDCKSQLIVETLNQLPSKYCVHEKGILMSKAKGTELQFEVDIIASLMRASKRLESHVKH